jgi:hypothetical protein
MDRRTIAAAAKIVLLICAATFFLTCPITGTWVCMERLTESAMLTDEITTITIRPDGTAEFRNYADYLGRYSVRHRSGCGETAGFDRYTITFTQGYGSTCTQFSNCAVDILQPFNIKVEHNRIRDTIMYTETGAPQFSERWPFVRSIERDCSEPEGCTGY